MRLVVTRQEYLDTAMRLLAADGAGELKIGKLCAALGVTSGSFYNYFGSWDGFVTALLEYWEQEQTDRIVVLSNAPPDPYERAATMKELAAGVPHETEAAIRAWGRSDTAVAEVQRRVDRVRHAALCAIVGGLVGDPGRVEMLASMGMAIFIGVQQWRSPVDSDELRRLLAEYEALIITHAEATAEH